MECEKLNLSDFESSSDEDDIVIRVKQPAKVKNPLAKESLICLESLTVTDLTESQTLEKGGETATSTPVKEDLDVDDD